MRAEASSWLMGGEIGHIGHSFIGNALCSVGGGGRLALPAFVRAGIASCFDSKTILIGVHEKDPCLIAYDRSFARALAADAQRRRIAEESSDPSAHHARARRIFGFVAEIGLDGRGRIALPPMIQRRAQIEDKALLVGTGGAFERWSPEVALASGDPVLVDLVAFHQLSRAA